MDYDVRQRAPRSRPARTGRSSRAGAVPRSDCITVALTAQAFLCAALILCVLIIKNTDEPSYSHLKDTYAEMSGSESAIELGAVFGSVTGGGILDKAKGLAEEFFSAKPLTDDEAQAEPETAAEPESGLEAAARYDYLGEDLSIPDASGGLMPVSPDRNAVLLDAPPGTTLAPVYLSARVKPPVTGIITSKFAYRMHPLSGKSDFHTGLDIAAEEGRAILAALPGEVVEVGENEIYGKYIVLKHATNLLTSYSHCSEIIARDGMAVRQGERIAKVGSTGMVTGPHLHFSVIVEGQFVDPEWALADSIKLVD